MQSQRLVHDIVRLFYPHTCIGCGSELFQKNRLLCHRCLDELPVTRFEKVKENYTFMLFAGRIRVNKASSWLFYGKDALTQKLIHQVKYRNNIELGRHLGYLMGKQLADSGWFNDIDVLIPLPLNKKKLAKRGFNQSMVLCEGLSDATGKPIEEVAVIRNKHTETQTKKSRIDRWTNVAEVFDLLDTDHLHHKHALLVDDVITTGATMEACGQVLMKVPGLNLSVLSLAVASKQ